MRKVAVVLLIALTLGLVVGCSSNGLSCASSKALKVTVIAEAAFEGNQEAIGKQVIFDFTKDGGDRFTLTRTVGESYRCSATVGYNLHKGESIVVKATVQGKEASTFGGTDEHTLTYEVASSWTDIDSGDDSVNWYPVLEPIIK